MSIPKEIPATDITAADTDTEIYLRTGGRRFELKGLVVSNNSTAAARVRIWDGPSAHGRKKFDMNIAAGETAEFDGKYRNFEYGNVTARADTVPVTVSGNGEEIA